MNSCRQRMFHQYRALNRSSVPAVIEAIAPLACCLARPLPWRPRKMLPKLVLRTMKPQETQGPDSIAPAFEYEIFASYPWYLVRYDSNAQYYRVAVAAAAVDVARFVRAVIDGADATAVVAAVAGAGAVETVAGGADSAAATGVGATVPAR